MKISKTRLELAMAAMGFNFIALSKASGVSRNTLSCIRNGKSCKPDVAGKIAVALERPIEQLVETESSAF